MVDVPRTAPVALAVLLALSATATPARAEPPDPDPWFGVDKALHFGIAGAITGGGYGLCSLVAPDVLSRSIVGVGFATGAISFKEAIDWAGYGHPSGKDIFWGFAGTAVGLGISISIDLALRSGEPQKNP
jgi:putative lipoprotein